MSDYSTSVALVGIGGRFPGARNPEEFWRNLAGGIESITPLSDDDLLAAGIDRSLLDRPAYVKAARLLDDADLFDARFFGLTHREAELMDPQHRLFLESAWDALDDSGYNAATFDGQVGVYAGSSVSTYVAASDHTGHARDALESLHVLLGNDKDYLATQLSYRLNLTGPSLAVQTACSTSLVAVCLASQALLNWQCDLALAGGVTVRLPQKTGYLYQEGGLFSPDGRCRPYDARAAGVVFGSGVGVVALKRAEDAIAAGDRIYALIRGWAVNNDGAAKVGFTAPGAEGQVQAVKLAQSMAGVEPTDIQLIEGHGTATPLGDAIELAALSRVFAPAGRRRNFCALGSVKANVGHLDAAAGVASLIKSALALHRECIPPSPNFEQPHPGFDLANSPFFVPTRPVPWPRGAISRIAGVSSFGIGGTNAHVILEEPPAQTAATRQLPSEFILPLSARDPGALRELAAAWQDLCAAAAPEALVDLCHTAAVRRTPHSERLAVTGYNGPKLAELLEAFLRGEGLPAVSTGSRPKDHRPKLAFVFGGQGGQWLGMGRELMEREPVFRQAMELCGAALRPYMSGPLLDILTGPECPRFAEIDFIQPAIFAVQVSQAALWRSWGIHPDAVIGQSMGEVAAAHVAGALSLEDAARVIARRSFLACRLVGRGAMAVVELSLNEARTAVQPYADRLAVAVSSSPRSTVLSGDAEALAEVMARMESQGIYCRAVKVDISSHSPQVDALRDDLLRELAPLAPRRAEVPVYSTVTAALEDGSGFDAHYWVRNFREPVLLADTLERALRDGFDSFLEIGPHPVVMPSMVDVAQHSGRAATVLSSTRRQRGERECCFETLAALFCRGYDPDWRRIYPDGRHAELPRYAWQRRRYWIDRAIAPPPAAAGGHPLVQQEQQSSLHVHERFWQADSNNPGFAYVYEHRVAGAALFPAAAYLEAALSAAKQVFGDAPVAIEGVSLESPLVFSQTEPARLQLTLVAEGPATSAFRFSSRTSGDAWTLHARGRIRATSQDALPRRDLDAVRRRCTDPVTRDQHYGAMTSRAIEYGPQFQAVESVWRGDGEALGRLRPGSREAHAIDPAFLDACLQVAGHAAPRAEGTGPLLPVGFDRIWIRGLPTYAHAHHSNLELLDESGNVVGQVIGFRTRAADPSADADPSNAWLYEPHWVEAPAAPPAGTAPRKWRIVPDRNGTATALEAELRASGQEIATGLESAHAIVYCAALDSHDAAGTAIGILELVQKLAQAGWRDAPRVWIVTRGALAQAPARGMARTIAIEHPEFRCCTIELDPQPSSGEARLLCGELLRDDAESAIALRGGVRYVERLERWAPGAPALAAAGGRPIRAEVRHPGILDSIQFVEAPAQALGSEEVRIKVTAAGLNFVDVLKALGTYPSDEGGSSLIGGECAGVVEAAGERSGFRPGDEVIAVAAGCFGTFVTAPARYVWHKPPALGFEEAAGVPIAFATAWYGLRDLARLAPGERVLIHSAAGGVGLAAVEIARQAGAELYCTAGTAEKREYLKSLGVRRVMDSRTSEFADEVLRATGGRGVDVVLNSLSGDALQRSLGVLAPYGRFVEIGKRDIYADTHIGLLALRGNRSYLTADLAGLVAERPDIFRRVMDAVLTAIGRDEIRPAPHHTVPLSQLADALREMAQGKHIGKLVISTADAAQVPVAPVPRQPAIGSDATYLITGGLGGLGLTLVPWFVARGARNLVLVGRSAPSPEAEATLAEARAAGARVSVVQADVADAEAMGRVLDGIRDASPPLRGIIHAAGVLDDGILLRLDSDRFRAVMAPKVQGSWNLHTLTADAALDFFVLFSSTSSVLGSPAQANHAAANAYLDALAHFRRSQSLPAVSINWGPWSEVGKAAAWRGSAMIPPRAGLDLLGRLLDGPPQVSVIPFELRQWREAFPAASSARLIDHLAQPAGRKGGTFAEQLRAAPPEARLGMIEAHVSEQLGRVLRLAPDAVRRKTPVAAQGLDSLMALELRNRLEMSLGLTLRVTLIWSYPTVAALARFLAEAMGMAEAPAPVAPDLDALSDEQAAALLIEEVARLEQRVAEGL